MTYVENPFQKLLPKLAVADDSILCLALALSICHRAAVLHSEQPNDLIEKLRVRSLGSFEKILKEESKKSDDIILLFVSLLGS